MADADVICLQEVARGFDTLAGSQGEDQFALLAAAFPGYTAIEGIAVDVPVEGGGRRSGASSATCCCRACRCARPGATCCRGRPTPRMPTCSAWRSRP